MELVLLPNAWFQFPIIAQLLSLVVKTRADHARTRTHSTHTHKHTHAHTLSRSHPLSLSAPSHPALLPKPPPPPPAESRSRSGWPKLMTQATATSMESSADRPILSNQGISFRACSASAPRLASTQRSISATTFVWLLAAASSRAVWPALVFLSKSSCPPMSRRRLKTPPPVLQ